MKRYNIFAECEDPGCYATEEIVEDVDGEWIKWEDCERLVKALKDISEFGRKNPGRGFSCAKMAKDILNAIGEEEWKRKGQK